MNRTHIIILILTLSFGITAVPRSAFAEEANQEASYLQLPALEQGADAEDYFDRCTRDNRDAEERCYQATQAAFASQEEVQD